MTTLDPRWVHRGMILISTTPRPQDGRELKPDAPKRKARRPVTCDTLAGRKKRQRSYVRYKPIGVICDTCGCLCKRREDCPMCLWKSLQTEQKEAA